MTQPSVTRQNTRETVFSMIFGDVCTLVITFVCLPPGHTAHWLPGDCILVLVLSHWTPGHFLICSSWTQDRQHWQPPPDRPFRSEMIVTTPKLAMRFPASTHEHVRMIVAESSQAGSASAWSTHRPYVLLDCQWLHDRFLSFSCLVSQWPHHYLHPLSNPLSILSEHVPISGNLSSNFQCKS